MKKLKSTKTTIITKERSYRNRRKCARYIISDENPHVDIEVPSGKRSSVELIDISANGCTVQSNQQLLKNLKASLHLNLMGLSLVVPFEVVSSKSSPDSHRYGLKFEQTISLENRKNMSPALDRRQLISIYEPAKKLNKRLKIWKEEEHYHLFHNNHTNNTEKIVDFTSNDYLAFTRNPQVLSAAQKGLELNLGTAGPAIFAGNRSYHAELARAIALFKKMDSCLLCPSGFSANSGLFTGLVKPGETILFLDEKDHASIFHGALASKGRVKIFRHNDTSDLEKKLAAYEIHAPKVICVDGIYSMDGDIAPLKTLHRLAKRYQASLWVDDAHSFGIMGRGGSGIEEHFGLQGQIDVVSGSLSKTVGAFGGYICAKKEVIQYLEHTGREFVFTTTLPDVICAGALESIRILQSPEGSQLRHQLFNNAQQLKSGLENLGYEVGPTVTPIIPLFLHNETLTQQFAQNLLKKGVHTNAVLRPAVRRGEARIRFTVRADHTSEQIDYALRAIAEITNTTKGIVLAKTSEGKVLATGCRE